MGLDIVDRLNQREARDLAAWARRLRGYRPCDRAVHRDGCCLPIVAGTVRQRGYDLSFDDLLDRWEALGRPGGKLPPLRSARSPMRPRPSGVGATRGRTKRSD